MESVVIILVVGAILAVEWILIHGLCDPWEGISRNSDPG